MLHITYFIGNHINWFNNNRIKVYTYTDNTICAVHFTIIWILHKFTFNADIVQ